MGKKGKNQREGMREGLGEKRGAQKERCSYNTLLTGDPNALFHTYFHTDKLQPGFQNFYGVTAIASNIFCHPTTILLSLKLLML